MKKIIWIIALGVIWFFILLSSPVSSYELNETDYDLIEQIDTRVIDLIDSRKNLSAERVVELFENFLNTRETNERFQVIVETVIDDIKYEYYLWEYAEDQITEDDCYDDEYFDTEEQTCVLKEASEEDYWDDTDYLDDYEHSHRNEEAFEEEEEILAKYEIVKNEILLLDGKHTEETAQVWNLFTKIIPLAYRWDFKNFSSYDNTDSDTAWYVAQNEDNNKQWDLTINLSHFVWEDGKLLTVESTETLIHEFAHVLTLSKSQMRYAPLSAGDAFLEKAKKECVNYFVGEWCLNSDSYFNRFIQQFWRENFAASQDDEEDDFYTGNESDFVTEYASTNPGEDIAESFTYFVLQWKPEDQTEASQKLLFFYKYPELVKLRDFIRMRIEK